MSDKFINSFVFVYTSLLEQPAKNNMEWLHGQILLLIESKSVWSQILTWWTNHELGPVIISVSATGFLIIQLETWSYHFWNLKLWLSIIWTQNVKEKDLSSYSMLINPIAHQSFFVHYVLCSSLVECILFLFLVWQEIAISQFSLLCYSLLSLSFLRRCLCLRISWSWSALYITFVNYLNEDFSTVVWTTDLQDDCFCFIHLEARKVSFISSCFRNLDFFFKFLSPSLSFSLCSKKAQQCLTVGYYWSLFSGENAYEN